MAFRGIDQPSFKSPEVAAEINALAETSLQSASAILHAVVDDEEIQGHLNGLPMYFDVMVSLKPFESLRCCQPFCVATNHTHQPSDSVCRRFRSQGIDKVCKLGAH